MPVAISPLLDERIWVRPHEAVSLARRLWTVLPDDESLVLLLESFEHPVDILKRLNLDATGLLSLTAPNVDDAPVAPPGTRVPWGARPTNVVRLLGRILDRVLPVPDAPPSYRVPDRLRALVHRAIEVHPPPSDSTGPDSDDRRQFRTVEEFLGMLRPFETGDGQLALADLYARWEACHTLRLAGTTTPQDDGGLFAKFTTADSGADSDRNVFAAISRVRETVGVSVTEIAERSKIPVGLIEAFEKGDLADWPKGLFGRQYVREYAREAGLDPDALLRLITPKLTPDESIDFIRKTWRSAADKGQPPTFHDPLTEGGRYYPEPILDERQNAGAPRAVLVGSKSGVGNARTTPPLGLLFGAASTADYEGVNDERPRRRLGRVATIGFLMLVVIVFVALLILEP